MKLPKQYWHPKLELTIEGPVVKSEPLSPGWLKEAKAARKRTHLGPARMGSPDRDGPPCPRAMAEGFTERRCITGISNGKLNSLPHAALFRCDSGRYRQVEALHEIFYVGGLQLHHQEGGRSFGGLWVGKQSITIQG